MVTSLSKCVARFDVDGRGKSLVEHLVEVATSAGSPVGSTLERLGFLAGLLHDVAKCHKDWQEYISPATLRKKGPPHSPFGAALFTFVAENLIKQWHSDRRERQVSQDRMLNWLLAINGHHGRLADFAGHVVPWAKVGSQYSVEELIKGCDMESVFELICQYFPEFNCSPESFQPWLESFERTWLNLAETNRQRQLETSESWEIAMRYPFDFSTLIIADRIHAGNLKDDFLEPATVKIAIETLAGYCEEQAKDAIASGASAELVRMRSDVQDNAIENYRVHQSGRFYTLLLPTGYGKTLASLRISLEACAEMNRKRIIYVAPYLSILSQATKEIADATEIEVFQHHHLSLAAMQSNQENTETASDKDFEALDTWKVPILSTTFNQFFRALFPSRAQHTLRIDAIKQSFIIVDEPQIVDISVWNLFLRALSVFAVQHDCQILFATATLPPMRIGLMTDAIALAPKVRSQHRYDIKFVDSPHNASSLADAAMAELSFIKSSAIVLNTVRDAATVFSNVKTQCQDVVQPFCLTAMMLPSHKQNIIQAIRDILKAQRDGTTDLKVIVACTQMLEAGVNLSFQEIWRARSVLPSIAQVAGRANRHNEGNRATINVFPFLSRDDAELRRFVYRDNTACRVTDEILTDHPCIAETEISDLLDVYFNRCQQENAQLARMSDFNKAALGEWSRLAGVEPFGFGPPREEVFVPIDLAELDESSQRLVQAFAPDGALQLLKLYCDSRYRAKLSFIELKRLQIATQLFVVPCQYEIATQIATKVNEWLWVINRTEFYSSETGLAHWLLRDVESPAEELTTIL